MSVCHYPNIGSIETWINMPSSSDVTPHVTCSVQVSPLHDSKLRQLSVSPPIQPPPHCDMLYFCLLFFLWSFLNLNPTAFPWKSCLNNSNRVYSIATTMTRKKLQKMDGRVDCSLFEEQLQCCGLFPLPTRGYSYTLWELGLRLQSS